jgi:hypothetical protein
MGDEPTLTSRSVAAPPRRANERANALPWYHGGEWPGQHQSNETAARG